MSDQLASVEISLRIPGNWANPGELIERLPEGVRLTPESLGLADGSEVGFGAVGADEQFAEIFRGSLRRPATERELEIVDHYSANVLLSGPGGSLDAARTMMQAAVAIIQAGGAGVFIDNCGLAHGGELWLAMTEDGSTDALSFAFASIIQNERDVYTMGLHVLGLRDIVMKRADCEAGFDIIDMIRYVARNEKTIADGHIVADLDGPRFQVIAGPSDESLRTSPMYNPFGRLKLVSLRDIAETN
jgi:hypothetical protein